MIIFPCFKHLVTWIVLWSLYHAYISSSLALGIWINYFSNVFPFILCWLPHISRWNPILFENLYISFFWSLYSCLFTDIRCVRKLLHVSWCCFWFKFFFKLGKLFNGGSSCLVSSKNSYLVVFSSDYQVSQTVMSEAPDCARKLDCLEASTWCCPNLCSAIISCRYYLSCWKSGDCKYKSLMAFESLFKLSICSPKLNSLIIWTRCKSNSWNLSKLPDNVIMSIWYFFLKLTLEPEPDWFVLRSCNCDAIW